MAVANVAANMAFDCAINSMILSSAILLNRNNEGSKQEAKIRKELDARRSKEKDCQTK
jgi:hypothetical protein